MDYFQYPGEYLHELFIYLFNFRPPASIVPDLLGNVYLKMLPFFIRVRIFG